MDPAFRRFGSSSLSDPGAGKNVASICSSLSNCLVTNAPRPGIERQEEIGRVFRS